MAYCVGSLGEVGRGTEGRLKLTKPEDVNVNISGASRSCVAAAHPGSCCPQGRQYMHDSPEFEQIRWQYLQVERCNYVTAMCMHLEGSKWIQN